jgi:hypothetical protein
MGISGEGRGGGESEEEQPKKTTERHLYRALAQGAMHLTFVVVVVDYLGPWNHNKSSLNLQPDSCGACVRIGLS